MYFVVLAFLPVVMAVDLDPTGANVCVVEESYEIPLHVERMVPEQYKTSGWCFGIPPRCTKYKTRWVSRVFTETRIEKRNVPRCCQGFVPNGVDCKAYCHDPCRHGICSVPETCTCFPGFRGPLCTAICSRGSWGQNCTQKCDCQNDAFCNPMNGVCMCTPGWRGKSCNDPCEDGYFGYECRRPCYCDGFSCHHITGECFFPTTYSTTEPTTTTELFTTTELTTTTMLTTESTTITETTTSEPSTIRTSTEIILVTPITLSTFLTEVEISTVPREETVTETIEEPLVVSNRLNQTNILVSNETSGRREIAGLILTVFSGAFSSLIILCAIAGLAFIKLRKPVVQIPLDTDTGLYAFYAEIPQPVFQNPTYGLRTPDEMDQKLALHTFKNDESTFEIELREILEAQYDHLPLPTKTRTPTPNDHLYDEILYASERRTHFS